MDLPEWVTDYWILWYFGFDGLLFVASFFMWNAGMKPLAMLVFLLALCPPLAFLGVLLEPSGE